MSGAGRSEHSAVSPAVLAFRFAARSRFEGSQENRAAFDFRCDEVEARLNREITPLRFVRMQ
jgi:hypothetical protein